MLLWEIDRSLAELSNIYGFDRASRTYRLGLEAARGMVASIEALSLGAGLRRRNALYLAPPGADESELREEHALRTRAGLPGRFLDRAAVRDEFAMMREAALWSPDSAEADPLRLAQALLQVAIVQGARMYDAEAVGYDCASRSVGVQFDNGHCVEARHVVLATGYVMPDFLKLDSHRIVSSFAIATLPEKPEALWRDGTLIWEASENDLYARTTTDGRIIAGGEDDEEAIEPDERNALMPGKADAIARRMSALWPRAAMAMDFVWSGAFGTTEDGLPLIGRVPGHPGIYAAYGYGGNGITFSYLAAQVIGELMDGRARPWFDDFAIDRELPKNL